jgi:heme-degrading monooxygenase HmoA
MVFEVVDIAVQPNQEAAFEAAMGKGRDILLRAIGCRNVFLRRGVESPSRYLLQIEWDSVDAHVAFTKSESIAAFRALIAPFFAERPKMEHFVAVH